MGWMGYDRKLFYAVKSEDESESKGTLQVVQLRLFCPLATEHLKGGWYEHGCAGNVINTPDFLGFEQKK